MNSPYSNRPCQRRSHALDSDNTPAATGTAPFPARAAVLYLFDFCHLSTFCFTGLTYPKILLAKNIPTYVK